MAYNIENKFQFFNSAPKNRQEYMNSFRKAYNEDKLVQFFLQEADMMHYPATKSWE